MNGNKNIVLFICALRMVIAEQITSVKQGMDVQRLLLVLSKLTGLLSGVKQYTVRFMSHYFLAAGV